MTAEEISKVKIKDLRDGRKWVAIVEKEMHKQADIMKNAGNNYTHSIAVVEHWKLRAQKYRLQSDMGKMVKAGQHAR